jgi:hypothetical protein
VAAVLGFEPRMVESKSTVLPLHYTASNYLASRQGLEPRPTVLETGMLPLHYRDTLYFWADVTDTIRSYEFHRLVCFHYTKRCINLVDPVGIEPTTVCLQSNLAPLSTCEPIIKVHCAGLEPATLANRRGCVPIHRP